MTEYGPVHSRGRGSITTVYLKPAFVFKRAADERQWSRLIYNLKVVYPIALEANLPPNRLPMERALKREIPRSEKHDLSPASN